MIGLLKEIFNTKPDGARSVGRPKLRWQDAVDQDIRILGVKSWKKVALNRGEWTQLLQKPWPTRDCRANDDDDDDQPTVYPAQHVFVS